MEHCYYIAHVDPVDAVDTSVRPCRIKVLRPLPQDRMEELLASCSADAVRHIYWDEPGYVTCAWSSARRDCWDEIITYAWSLAESEGAMVLNELFGIEYPPEARELQRALWASSESR